MNRSYMSRRKAAPIFASAVLALNCGAVFADDGWQSLFNGKNLDGWTAKFTGYPAGHNLLDTFRAEGGILKVALDKYEHFDRRFGLLFYQSPFSGYRLKFEYRFHGEQLPGGPGWAFRNSGVMIHSQSPGSMKQDQEFPVSIEVQLLGQVGDGHRPTGNVCTPGTHIVMNGALEKTHCVNSASKTYPGDGWVSAEIEVSADGVINHYIEGDLVLSYSAPQLDPNDADARDLMKNDALALKGGFIAFQAESHPVEFRHIKIKNLRK